MSYAISYEFYNKIFQIQNFFLYIILHFLHYFKHQLPNINKDLFKNIQRNLAYTRDFLIDIFKGSIKSNRAYETNMKTNTE